MMVKIKSIIIKVTRTATSSDFDTNHTLDHQGMTVTPQGQQFINIHQQS